MHPESTQRLRFREWSPHDFELAWQLYGDIEVTRLFGGPFSREQVQQRLDREIGNLTKLRVQYWPMFLIDNDDFVGCCGLRPHGEIYALGFHLRPAHWSRGYATEAARAVIDYAFTTLGATTLFAGHHPQNAPSKRALEGLGFEYWQHSLYEPTGLQHPGYLLRRGAAGS
jgi:RimJ/RimL family protein N-acetyltransferase